MTGDPRASCAGASATACSSRASDEGYLEIDVRKRPGGGAGRRRACTSRSRWRTSTRRSRPWLARWFYSQTQSRIHVLVTHGFLRSLARLDLEESAVGRFAAYGPQLGLTTMGTTNGSPHAAAAAEEAAEPVTVGDTPWRVIAALAVAEPRHRRRAGAGDPRLPARSADQ